MWIRSIEAITRRLDSLEAKFDKLIEIQERPYEAERQRLDAQKREIVHRTITDLIDPKHYDSVKNKPDVQ
jgi:hypothetical protein